LQKKANKIKFGTVIAGYIRDNWKSRFHQKAKPSSKRYNRKKERSINKNPLGDNYE